MSNRSGKSVLNEANPNRLAGECQRSKLGTLLSNGVAFVRGAVASHIMVLPENQKAAAVISGYSNAGSTTGKLAPTTGSITTGLIGINAVGDVLFASADVVTEAEVRYLPVEGVVYEETVSVASNIGAPLASRKGLVLLSATSTAGTLTGALTVVARGGTPTTGQVALTATGTVAFAGADAVTRATIKYIATPGFGSEPVASVPALLVESSPL